MTTRKSINWQRHRIRDLCLAITDCVNKTAPIVDYQTSYKMLRTTNVKNGWILTEDLRCVTEQTFRTWTRREIPKKGDIILTREAPLGDVGMIRSDESYFLGQRLISFRTNNEKLDNKFLLYSFQSPDLKGQVMALGSGSTVQHMKVPDAENLTILIPDIKMQRKVSSIIAVYDDLIENNEKRIKILEEMAQRLYTEWFVKFKFPGHENVNLVDSGTEFGMIPENWSAKKFYDVVKNFDAKRKPISSIIRAKSRGIYPYYGAAKIIDFIDKYIFDGTYLLIGEDGTVITKDGKAMMQFVKGKFWVSNHAHVVQGEILSTEMVYLRMNAFSIASLITGAAQPKITKENLSRILFLVPEPQTRDAFETTVRNYLSEVLVLKKINDVLVSTRDFLISQLVTGKRELKS